MINWKLRLKNKAVLMALAATALAFVYQVLGILGITPPISQQEALNIIAILLTLLAGLGIIVDPTTAGVKDSARAMQYDEPQKVTVPDETFPVGGEAAGNDETEHEATDPPDPEV